MEKEFLHQSEEYINYPFDDYCFRLFETIYSESFYELFNTDPEDPYPPYIATEAIKWHIRQWFHHHFYQHHLFYDSQPLSIVSFLQQRNVIGTNYKKYIKAGINTKTFQYSYNTY